MGPAITPHENPDQKIKICPLRDGAANTYRFQSTLLGRARAES